jgi:uncharacterized membrane protein (DUF2068 family)
VAIVSLRPVDTRDFEGPSGQRLRAGAFNKVLAAGPERADEGGGPTRGAFNWEQPVEKSHLVRRLQGRCKTDTIPPQDLRRGMNNSAPGAGRRPLSGGFVSIILFKYFKAFVFGLFGAAALRLAHLAGISSVTELARFFRVSPERQIIQSLASVIQDLTPGQAIGIGVVSLVVGMIFAAEATLLSLRVWWSTYFTVVLTACGIPPEIYEIAQQPYSVRRYLLLAVNAAILMYVWKRRNEFRDAFPPDVPAEGKRDESQVSTSSG